MSKREKATAKIKKLVRFIMTVLVFAFLTWVGVDQSVEAIKVSHYKELCNALEHGQPLEKVKETALLLSLDFTIDDDPPVRSPEGPIYVIRPHKKWDRYWSCRFTVSDARVDRVIMRPARGLSSL